MPAPMQALTDVAVPALAGVVVALALFLIVWSTRSIRYIPGHRSAGASWRAC